MYHTFLIDIIRALDEKSRQEAVLFLASPYFNRSSMASDVQALYGAILSAAPDFKEENLDRDHIYVLVFPGKPVIPGKLDKLMTELKKQLRLFALAEGYFSDEKEEWQELHWASWLRSRGMGEKFKLSLNKLKKQGRTERMPGDRLLLQIAEEEYDWESYVNDLSSDLAIPNMIRQLDLYYYVYREHFVNIALLQQKTSSSRDLSFLSRDKTYYESQSPILKLIREVGQLYQKEEPEIAGFERLLGLIGELKPHLPEEILKTYYPYLRNICTFLIDAGRLEFIPILHQIHKSNLSDGYFNVEGKMHVNAYLNLVQIALRAREITWAKEVVETYKNTLHGGDPDHFFYRLNLAYCLFAEGKYDEALTHIPETQSAPHYYLMTRRLELKAYYELDSDLLPYKMDSFRKFIERTAPKAIAENLREMNLNFIYILNQLSQTPKKDRKRAEKILERIEKRTQLCERTWLIEKANQLK